MGEVGVFESFRHPAGALQIEVDQINDDIGVQRRDLAFKRSGRLLFPVKDKVFDLPPCVVREVWFTLPTGYIHDPEPRPNQFGGEICPDMPAAADKYGFHGLSNHRSRYAVHPSE